MVVSTTTVTLVLDHSLEEGCKELCGSPYFIKRVEKEGIITWYGENYNWSLKENNWTIFPYEKRDTMFVSCAEPEYEKMYQRILSKQRSKERDIQFSLNMIATILGGMFAYWIYHSLW